MRLTCGLLLAALTLISGGAASPDLAGIAHVAFRVEDVSQARDFYAKLGFEQAFEYKDANGKTSVSYMKINDRQFIELYQRGPSDIVGLMHVCFEAVDTDSVWKEYQSRGIEASAPKKARAGNLLFAIHNPEGQLIEYTQYLAGSMHFEDRGKHLGVGRVSQQLVRVTIPVKDVEAETALYAKLGFILGKRTGKPELRLPGNSRQEIDFEPAEVGAGPEILFEVNTIAKAVDELRSRGLKVQRQGAIVSMKDPNGNSIALISQADWREGR